MLYIIHNSLICSYVYAWKIVNSSFSYSFSFCKRKGCSKDGVFVNPITTKNNIDLKEKAFGDEAKKPLPVKPKSQSSVSSTEISQ